MFEVQLLWGDPRSSVFDEMGDIASGAEFDDEDYCREIFENAERWFASKALAGVTHVRLLSPDGTTLALREIVRAWVAPANRTRRSDPADHEYAMLAGMAGGCEAYNEAIGSPLTNLDN